MNDLDYVEFYAKNLKKNKKFFLQQKKLINSQFRGSKILFKKRFGTGEEFKINARKYLRDIGLI